MNLLSNQLSSLATVDVSSTLSGVAEKIIQGVSAYSYQREPTSLVSVGTQTLTEDNTAKKERSELADQAVPESSLPHTEGCSGMIREDHYSGSDQISNIECEAKEVKILTQPHYHTKSLSDSHECDEHISQSQSCETYHVDSPSTEKVSQNEQTRLSRKPNDRAGKSVMIML